MAVNPLGIDITNLAHDFQREWSVFTSGRVGKFLKLYLQKELQDARARLENVSPADLGKVQGTAAQTQKFLTLLERPNADETVKEVLAFVDKQKQKYG